MRRKKLAAAAFSILMSDTEFGTGLRAHLARDPLDGTLEDAGESAGEDACTPSADELELRLRALEAAEARLDERERKLLATQAAVAAHAQLLVEREEELDRRSLAAAGAAARDVRELLRRRAEEHADRIWRTLDQALAATRPDGGIDHGTRLAALQLLINDAFSTSPVPAATVEDELARLRYRKAAHGTV